MKTSTFRNIESHSTCISDKQNFLIISNRGMCFVILYNEQSIENGNLISISVNVRYLIQIFFAETQISRMAVSFLNLRYPNYKLSPLFKK